VSARLSGDGGAVNPTECSKDTPISQSVSNFQIGLRNVRKHDRGLTWWRLLNIQNDSHLSGNPERGQVFCMLCYWVPARKNCIRFCLVSVRLSRFSVALFGFNRVWHSLVLADSLSSTLLSSSLLRRCPSFFCELVCV